MTVSDSSWRSRSKISRTMIAPRASWVPEPLLSGITALNSSASSLVTQMRIDLPSATAEP